MKNILKFILIIGIFILPFHDSFGQVSFELQWLEDTEVYQVAVVSEATYSAPQNMVSTAQITLKVPNANFEMTDFQNLIPGVEFELNSITSSPSEAPDFDYLSFGLTTFGAKIPLFEGEKNNSI